MKAVDVNLAGFIGSRQLAGIMGIDLSTLCRWVEEQPALRKAKVRRGVFSIRLLRAAGILQEGQGRRPRVEDGVTRVPFTTARAAHLVAAFRNRLDAAVDTAELMEATEAARAFDAAILAADREAFWNSTEEPCAA